MLVQRAAELEPDRLGVSFGEGTPLRREKCLRIVIDEIVEHNTSRSAHERNSCARDDRALALPAENHVKEL